MKKNINFFAVLRDETRVRPNPVKVGIISLVALLTVGQIVYYVYQRGVLADLQLQLDNNAAAINSTSVLELLSNNDLINDYTAKVEKDIATTKLLQARLDSEAGFRSQLYQTVANAAPADVVLQSFSYLDNTVSITCTTGDNAPPSSYTVALIDTGLFAEVAYHGFTAVTTEVQGQSLINFPIICRLKPVEVPANDET